jgi:CBS domain-containing protein
MGRVADILAVKGSQVHHVSPEATAYDAIAEMVRRNVGSLLVIEAGEPAGIFTERDYLRRVTLQRRDPRSLPIRDVMTPRPIYVEPQKTIAECMAIMTEQRIRHLPVMEGGRVVGLISIGDLVKHLSREQATEIQELTRYITGSV